MVHGLPNDDGPYARATKAKLGEPSKGIEPDLVRAEVLLRESIQAGDRVDSAVKDLAIVTKRLRRPGDAVRIIDEMRHLCSAVAQRSLDNLQYEMYRSCRDWQSSISLLEKWIAEHEEQ
eukprot:1487279-Prymnesium_polylepis.1